MKITAERRFDISPNQYQLFKFSVSRPSTLYIKMIATDPVDVLLLDSSNRFDYENGSDAYSSFSWRRRISIDDAVEVEPDTWYIVVEGRDDWSRGTIQVFQQ